MLSFDLPLVLATISSLLAVNWIYFKVLKIAKDKSIVDSPDARKLQKAPVPILGGIAVFFGVVTGVFAGSSFSWLLSDVLLYSPAWILCAMVMMVYVGATDDILGLTPRSRFVVELLTILGLILSGGGCIDSLHGLWGVESFSWWIAVPLTLVAGVGIINAVNMIDGVNGLSSGLCISCCLMFGIVFRMVGDLPDALLAFTMAASLAPFLFHNVFGSKSRMFIGDAGTMMMGVAMAWFTISMLRSDTSVRLIAVQKNVNMIAMTLAILSVPVFDTVRVMLLRILHKKSPFHPDKTHLHHIFIRMGVSHSITALTEVVIDLAIVGIWALSVKMRSSLDWQLYIVVVSSLALVWGVYFLIRRLEESHSELMHRLTRFSIKTHLGSTNGWLRLQKWLDAPVAKYDLVNESSAAPKAGSLEVFYRFDDIPADNFRAQDRKRMYDFMNGKAEVFVDDIKRRSGADPLRVEDMVREGIADGFICVIKEGAWGAPNIITLIERENERTN